MHCDALIATIRTEAAPYDTDGIYIYIYITINIRDTIITRNKSNSNGSARAEFMPSIAISIYYSRFL